MATHSSILAWRIPGTEEPDGLRFIGSHRIRHDSSDLAGMQAYQLVGSTLGMQVDLQCSEISRETIWQ